MTETPVRNTKQSILDVAKHLVSKKGFSAVGLNEVLQAAQVPKGSFYHYFGSKDAFGVALLERYFEAYLQRMSEIFNNPELTERQKLASYWKLWIENQTADSDSGRCLAVKLGAEVADLSEPMRQALERGTSCIIDCIAMAIVRGVEDGSLAISTNAPDTARQLYSLWLGASVMVKITKSELPFDHALLMTHEILGFSR